MATLALLGAALCAGCARESAHQGPNVLLISIDTCRADRLGCYGFERPTTPHIDALAARGTLFERASTTDPITLPAHTSLLTGTLPLLHGVHDNNYRVGGEVVTLAQQLRDAGWSTAAFVSSFVLDSRFGLDRGFELYDDTLDGGGGEEPDPLEIGERDGESTSRAALDWLARQGGDPFFLFLHYFDPHARYAPPEPFASEHADDLYAGEVAYVDHCIGQVLDGLDELGLGDDTLVVVTADHGESLGEHGERTHAWFAYQATIHVPLIVALPGARGGLRVPDPVSVIDVAPTVLSLLGLEPTAGQVGQDLSGYLAGSPPPGERDVYCQSLYPTKFGCGALRGLVRGRWKYISSVEPELYDLLDDPREARNLHDREPQVAADLRARLTRLLDGYRDVSRGPSAPMGGQDGLRQIQALGYAGGAVSASLEPVPGAQDAKQFLGVYERYMEVHPLRVAGRSEEAARICREVLEVRPGLLEAIETLGSIAVEQGRPEDAIERYREYLQHAAEQREGAAPGEWHPLDPGTGRVLLAMGDELRELRRLPEALECYQRAAQTVPDWPDAAIALGDLLAQDLGNYGQAIVAYRAALGVDSRESVAHKNLGNCYFALGRLEEAARSYRQGLEIDPSDAQAWHNLGSVRLEQGRPDQAVEPLGEACRLDPTDAASRVRLGRALSLEGRWDEARRAFVEAIDLDPTSGAAAFGLGLCLLEEGRRQEALAVWERQALLGGEQLRRLDVQAWQLAGRPDADLYRPAAALQLARLLVELTNGRDPLVHDTLGRSQAATGDFDAAEDSVERALELLDGQDPALEQALQERLELYRDERPYIGPRVRAPSR